MDALETIGAVTKGGRGYYQFTDGRQLTKSELADEIKAHSDAEQEWYKEFYDKCFASGYMRPYQISLPNENSD